MRFYGSLIIRCPFFMKSEESKRSGLSESFVVGVIAVVFLIVGYQTALFIHRAAVTKIVSNRDVPDTIYVYKECSGSVQDADILTQSPQLAPSLQTRQDAEHHPVAASVRQNAPAVKRTIESFVFNPNTVTVDELYRLGFTLKQAQSIDNYRIKGGVFHRKDDFAKSYVVSDSIYRRLEPYIRIPLLDLNKADLESLDNLPGIGTWFAKKIIEYRDQLNGYSFKEQLLDIYNFDMQKYDALKDLITVDEPYQYPLWNLPADSLRKHPYIRNLETARSIVLFRDNNSEQLWTVENLCQAGILSESDADRLGRCVR